MKTLSYTICLLTPAFLGDAKQEARWRTPPFKALLRQWWRVAFAHEHNFEFDLAEMRYTEGRLFGHAWLSDDHDERGGRVTARKSKIRIRLEVPGNPAGNAWSTGSQSGVDPLPTNLETGYAWFGLVDSKSKQPLRKAIAPHGPEAQRLLKIAFPSESESERLELALQLIDRFGQLGARSRGAWGSLKIEGITAIPDSRLMSFARELGDCLDHDWPMSLGYDDQGLMLWVSQRSFETWDQAMKVIAAERRMVRVALKALGGRDLRPVLGFAKNSGRMPSPLRWRLAVRDETRLGIEVFAMPALIPSNVDPGIGRSGALTAWQSVIRALDQSSTFGRAHVNSVAGG